MKESCKGLLRDAGLRIDQFAEATGIDPGPIFLVEKGTILLEPAEARAYQKRVAEVAKTVRKAQ